MNAKLNSSPSDLVESENGITLSSRRRDVALESCWEIEELALVLATNMPRNDGWLAIRGVAARILELSRISMNALSDPSNPTEALLLRLTLEKADEVTA